MTERPWWKIILYIFALIGLLVMGFGISGGAAALLTPGQLEVTLSDMLRIPVTLALFFAFSRWVLRRPLSYFRLTRNPTRTTLLWILVGVALPALVIGSYWLLGKLEVLPPTARIDPQTILLYAAESLAIAAASGFLEELLFRGFILRLVEEKWNATVAILAPSLLFGLAHVNTESLAGFLQVLAAGTLVGVLFSLIVYVTGSIWNAAIVHALWNFVFVGRLVGLAAFDGPLGRALFPVRVTSEELIYSGGAFGVEAALPAVLVYGAAILWILVTTRPHKAERSSAAG